MYDLLCVYNICGINGRNNLDYYIKAIDIILRQKKINHRVVLSSCLNDKNHILKIKNHFKEKIDYIVINELVTINVSFNKAVLECVKHYGKFKDYVYIDSGAMLQTEYELCLAYDFHKNNNYGITYCGVDTDTGYNCLKEFWHEYPYRIDNLPRNPYELRPGDCVHPHVQIISNDILDFYEKLWPDIFATFGTESTFAFLCSAIRKKSVVFGDVVVHHISGLDGGSSGFMKEHDNLLEKQNDGKQLWNHTYKTNKSIKDIIFDQDGINYGFGHEEFQSLLHHKADQYDNCGLCVNNNLKYWLKDNIFLKKKN